jgi:hypothetical protein
MNTMYKREKRTSMLIRLIASMTARSGYGPGKANILCNREFIDLKVSRNAMAGIEWMGNRTFEACR